MWAKGMSMSEKERLERRFHAAMLDGYEQIKAETGYNATYFLQMVREQGGLRAAKNLLAKPGPSAGLTRLWEEGRLDLSLEAFVLKPEFAPLFSEQELTTARQRLIDYGYKPEEYGR